MRKSQKPGELALGIPEAARMLGVSTNLIYKEAAAGNIPGVRRIGQKRLVIVRSIFEQWLQAVQ